MKRFWRDEFTLLSVGIDYIGSKPEPIRRSGAAIARPPGAAVEIVLKVDGVGIEGWIPKLKTYLKAVKPVGKFRIGKKHGGGGRNRGGFFCFLIFDIRILIFARRRCKISIIYSISIY